MLCLNMATYKLKVQNGKNKILSFVVNMDTKRLDLKY